MWNFIVYLGESAISLAVLYLLYKATMSYETLHRLNRVVLLGSVVLAAVLPLCHIKIEKEVEAVPQMAAVDDVAMDMVVAEQGVDAVAVAQGVVMVLFLLGVAVMVARLVTSQISVWRVVRSGEQRELADDVTLTVVEKLPTPFSWFSRVVVDRDDEQSNLDLVLEHELAHIRLHHSWDVLAVDIALCVWWFNPALWLLRRELQSLHEYQADEAVLRRGIDVKTYQILLIKRAVGSRLHSVANCLNHSNLKNRITMMCKKTSSRWSAAKLLLVLPLVALSLAATATTIYVPKELNKGNENLVNEQNQKPNLRQALQMNLRGQGGVGVVNAEIVLNPDGTYEHLLVAKHPKEKSEGYSVLIHEVERAFEVAIKVAELPKETTTYRYTISFCIQEENGIVKSDVATGDDAIVVMTYSGDMPFIKCEKMPTFQGGDLNAYRNWMQSQLQYPKEAKDKGIKGRVIFSFVVEKDGSVSNFDALQAPDKILVEEVERVFKLTPKWEPGKQNGKTVRVKFTVPIVFTGDDVAEIVVDKNKTAAESVPAAVKTQTTSAKPIGEEAFVKVESMPTFQGGDLNGYRNWFQSQLQYPAEAKEKGIKGRVIFSFVVEKDGSVSNFDALQAPDKILVDEVERVFKLTPKWEPGKQNGKEVRVKFTVPITFTL